MNGAIEAAQLTAHAAILAAWVQGLLTVVAGLLAILGGWLAYRGAIRAAARQVQLMERRDEARVRAYRFRLGVLADDLGSRARFSLSNATFSLERFRKRGGSQPMLIGRWPDFPEFSPASWEDHALLGQAAVCAIHELWQCLEEYRRFQGEVLREDLKCNDHSAHSPPIGELLEGPDGSLTISIANVVETDEILVRKVVESVDALKSVL